MAGIARKAYKYSRGCGQFVTAWDLASCLPVTLNIHLQGGILDRARHAFGALKPCA